MWIQNSPREPLGDTFYSKTGKNNLVAKKLSYSRPTNAMNLYIFSVPVFSPWSRSKEREKGKGSDHMTETLFPINFPLLLLNTRNYCRVVFKNTRIQESCWKNIFQSLPTFQSLPPCWSVFTHFKSSKGKGFSVWEKTPSPLDI